MNTDRYIVGDFIIYTSLFKEPVAEICEVCETSYTIRFMQGNLARVTSKEIKPIPLTPKILEKNGWKFYGQHEKIWWNDDESWISYNNITKTDINLRFYTDGNFFLPCLKDKEISVNSIKYVHELQHLLFGLGINSEMEVC